MCDKAGPMLPEHKSEDGSWGSCGEALSLSGVAKSNTSRLGEEIAIYFHAFQSTLPRKAK